jgi:PmbA protein
MPVPLISRSTAIEQTVQAAFDIARFTAEDPFAALPDPADVAQAAEQRDDLQLFFPWTVDSEQQRNWLCWQRQRHCKWTSASPTVKEQAFRRSSRTFSAPIRTGFVVVTPAHATLYRYRPLPARETTCSVTPGTARSVTLVTWLRPEAIGRYAAERALSRLRARKIATLNARSCLSRRWRPVCWGVSCRPSVVGLSTAKVHFCRTVWASWYFPKHIDVLEDPFVLRGKGSSPFDDEGVRVQARSVVEAGRVQGYFLGSYSARKLGMKTTGNAGGSHNLRLSSRLTSAADDLDAMLRRLGTGLFVTELMGSGVNYVTGDYSRGASGFWVEQGRIAYPVHEITIAGNMKPMLKGIVAVGADVYNYGSKTVGSVLIDRMKVAGS